MALMRGLGIEEDQGFTMCSWSDLPCIVVALSSLIPMQFIGTKDPCIPFFTVPPRRGQSRRRHSQEPARLASYVQ